MGGEPGTAGFTTFASDFEATTGYESYERRDFGLFRCEIILLSICDLLSLLYSPAFSLLVPMRVLQLSSSTFTSS